MHKKWKPFFWFFVLLLPVLAFAQNGGTGNPLFEGWYADPEAVVIKKRLWIFPTFSAKYKEQVFFDAFSSKNGTSWQKHGRILDTSNIKWARIAMWAPSLVQKDKKYFLFFSQRHSKCSP